MKNQITYTKQGDYYLPSLTLPEQSSRPIGVWGQRHKDYLLYHHKVRYYDLLTSCKLVDYLANINQQAEEMYESLVTRITKQEGVTEQIKANNQMLWIQRMNNIRNRATEIVNKELISV